MSESISIRKANQADAQAAWDLRNAAIDSQCTGHYPAELLQIWTSGEITEEFVKRVAGSYYVATRDGVVIGTGMIDLRTGKIDAMAVHPSHMGGGAGKRILAHLERLAREAGLTCMVLESTLNAAPFYRACGFVGQAMSKYDSPRGISLDCIPMTKTLDPIPEVERR